MSVSRSVSFRFVPALNTNEIMNECRAFDDVVRATHRARRRDATPRIVRIVRDVPRRETRASGDSIEAHVRNAIELGHGDDVVRGERAPGEDAGHARGRRPRQRRSSYAEIIEFDVVVLEFELGIRSRHDVARERRVAL